MENVVLRLRPTSTVCVRVRIRIRITPVFQISRNKCIITEEEGGRREKEQSSPFAQAYYVKPQYITMKSDLIT